MPAKRSETLVPALSGLGLGLVVFVLAVIGKNHFGPLDGLCNGSLELEPHQGAGAIANCTFNTTFYSVSVYAYWAAIVVGALSAVVLVLGLAAAPESPPRSGTLGVTRASKRTGASGLVASSARARDADRQHIRCTKCNALNYAREGDVPCYACGTALR
jgi:hypothetical protein